MAKIAKSRRRLLSRQFKSTPYPTPSYGWKTALKEVIPKKTSLALEEKDWEGATCSVCMEFPHNAVLLLCSSHDKGCRPYMCGTSYRHSNCLDQFKKAYTKVMNVNLHESLENPSMRLATPGWSAGEKAEILELTCPLCRGQVKGWTVVEPAREYLNNKMRSCMQENCPFMGTYRELRKHVRSEHPSAKPREVDPLLEQKWRTLEGERERQDVISTIRSSMPGSIMLGDYVIEMDHHGFEDGEVGDGDGGDLERADHSISRSILYFFLQEGARFMRLHRDDVSLEGRDDSGHTLPLSDGDADVGVPYSEGDDDTTPAARHGRIIDVLRSEGRRRRRRRRSLVGLS